MKLINYFFVIFFLSINFSEAKIIKPNKTIKPIKVVEIQLDGLMKNDEPNKDNGIIQTWEFAHPNNKKFTGPIERFKEMIKGESYKILINHSGHEIKEVYLDNKKAIYEVYILGNDKKYFKFKWQVEKYLDKGPLKNCWLTTIVSQPMRITDTA
tara:strand:- start:94 stop:555 length:462 start_codon:yes stop_codon:yes gene_type:complete